ncbi:MAG: divergent polysaccharide deacetylase family protein, partial [Paracoccaceae bacterium]
AEPDAEPPVDDVPNAETAVSADVQPSIPPAVPLTDAPPQTASRLPATADVVTNLPAAEAVAALPSQDPATLTAPGADAAPASSELPPPPPLTPEEEAMLADPAQIVIPGLETTPGELEQAADDSALATSPVAEAPELVPDAPEPEVAAEAPPEPEVTTVPEAQPEIIAVDGAPATLSPDSPLDIDGPSTLPATPSLIVAEEAGAGDRMPQIGETPVEAAPAEALPEVSLDAGPAMARFSVPFENPDAKPLFAILLIDTGEADVDRQATATLPFPVTIVIDPLSQDAAAHAALYRAGGKEVVMLASGIPEGATPADLEQTFEAHAAALPEAVAVIDRADGAFQNDRPLSTQLVPILVAQGRGLLTWDRGLNAADQVARREGLPTTMIFRQIDAEGEGVPEMRRYLDRAAFKSAQEGQVTVIGTLRAETLAALLEWTIEGRSA